MQHKNGVYYDCEIEVYLVEDEDGNIIYQSNTDQTDMIEKLMKEN